MTEDPGIIELNIARYRELLHLHLDEETRARVKRLLSEATSQLALAIELSEPSRS